MPSTSNLGPPMLSCSKSPLSLPSESPFFLGIRIPLTIPLLPPPSSSPASIDDDDHDDDVQSNLTKRRTDEALAQLSRMVPHVIGLIQQPLTSSGDDAVRMKCLEALAGWCKFGVSVTNLRQSQLYPLVVSFLQHPVLCKPACEVFEAAVNTESYPAEPDELILEIVSLVVSLRPLYSRAAASGNDAYCEGVCNLTKSLMIRRPELLASGGGECLALADFCLEMTGHTNRGISEAALEFWDELQCIEMPTRHESLRRDVFASLIKVLAKCAAYSPDADDEDEDGDDDFNMYRRRVEEALLNCACCLRSSCLTILCNLLGSAGGKWQEWESILYSMTCVSGEILTLQMQSEREVILNNITTLLTGFIFPAAHPQHELVRRAALKVMESYSKCLQQNLDLVEPSLIYILPLLPSRKLHPQVARAFAGVCSKGRVYLSKPETLNKLISAISGRYGEVQKEGMQLCVEALGRVLSVLGPAEMVESLKGLVSPFVERLRALTAGQSSMFIRASSLLEAADLVKLIGAAIRFLEPPETAAGDTHPVTAVLHEAWPVLDAVCTKFLDTAVSEAVQGLFVNALRQAKAEAHPLLHSMMGACLSTYRSSKCGACLESVGVAVEIFGGLQGAAQNFGGLAVELSSITFEMIQSAGVATSPGDSRQFPRRTRTPPLSLDNCPCLTACSRVALLLLHLALDWTPFPTTIAPLSLLESCPTPFAHCTRLDPFPYHHCPFLTSHPLPDVITAYFEMCYRFLLFCPDALVAQASFPSTMDLSLACIPLKEKEPLRAIFCFIERAAAIPSPMWESCAAQWFSANGAGLYKALIWSLSDSCPPEAIPRLSPLLFSLNARMAGHAQHWMVAALSAPDYPVPPNVLDDTAKKHFVQANANLASNQRRFLAMIQDFAQICRQQQTSDALVAYQM